MVSENDAGMGHPAHPKPLPPVLADVDALHLEYLRFMDKDRRLEAAARAGINLGAVERQARECGARLVVLCGSFAKGSEHPDSDVDIVYEPGPGSRGDFMVESGTGVPVDMHSFNQLGPHSRADVLLTGTPLYEAEPGIFWSARADAIKYMLSARQAMHGAGVDR